MRNENIDRRYCEIDDEGVRCRMRRQVGHQAVAAIYRPSRIELRGLLDPLIDLSQPHS